MAAMRFVKRSRTVRTRDDQTPTAGIHREVKPQFSSPIVTWTAHPARQRPRAAIGAVVIILLVGAAAWLSFGVAWGIGSVLLLVASLNRFFLPSRFAMNELELVARFPLRTQRIEWRHVRRFATDEHGGYLSTRAAPSRLDAYRGVHLLFGADREAVVGQIRTRLKAPHAAVSAMTSSETNSAIDNAHIQVAGGNA